MALGTFSRSNILEPLKSEFLECADPDSGRTVEASHAIHHSFKGQRDTYIFTLN